MRPSTSIVAIVVVLVIAAAALFAYFTYGSGTLQINMTDPPLSWGEATQVYLNYSAIEVHRADAGNESGWSTVIDKSAWINLTRTLDVNQTIGSKNLQAGLYNLVRFRILESKVTVGGINHTATVPSGELTIAITTGGIRVNTGQTAIMLIDLNVKVEGSKTLGFRIVPTARATPV